MQKTLLLLAAGMLCGMATCSLLQQPNRLYKHKPVSAHTTTADIVQNEKREETIYQAEKNNLLQKIDILRHAQQQATQQLTKVKAANKQLQQQVAITVQQLSIKTDTLAYILHCDSLQTQAAELATGYNLQDSLVQEQVSYLQQEAVIRDNLIAAADTRIQSVSISLSQSLRLNQSLETELILVKKQNKKQRFHSTIKTLAMVTAAFWIGKR